jgi:hypothetical protein
MNRTDRRATTSAHADPLSRRALIEGSRANDRLAVAVSPSSKAANCTTKTDIIPALAAVFTGFDFSLGLVDDHYRRDSRSVIQPDGTRVGELREWMTGELAKDGGNINALWSRLKENDLQTTVWCGTSAYAFAPTGPGASDYIQIALGRESGFRDGRIVNRESRPRW